MMAGSPELPNDDTNRGSESAAGMPAHDILWWADLVSAVAALTRTPLPRVDHHSVGFGRATLFFPLIGFGVGAVLLLIDVSFVAWCPRWVLAFIVVGVWEFVSAGWNAPRMDRGIKWRSASYWIVVAMKLVAVTRAATRPVALLFAPMLASWAIVVLAVGARDADHPGQKYNNAITFREFAIASVFTFAVVFTVAEALGVVVVLAAAGMTLILRIVAHRRYGGVRWEFLSAGARGIELFVLLLFALV